MWAAAGNDPSHPVLDWLVEQRVHEPVEFHGGHTTTAEAAREGWQALRTAMRIWGIRSHHDLSAWLPHLCQGTRIRVGRSGLS